MILPSVVGSLWLLLLWILLFAFVGSLIQRSFAIVPPFPNHSQSCENNKFSCDKQLAINHNGNCHPWSYFYLLSFYVFWKCNNEHREICWKFVMSYNEKKEKKNKQNNNNEKGKISNVESPICIFNNSFATTFIINIFGLQIRAWSSWDQMVNNTDDKRNWKMVAFFPITKRTSNNVCNKDYHVDKFKLGKEVNL